MEYQFSPQCFSGQDRSRTYNAFTRHCFQDSLTRQCRPVLVLLLYTILKICQEIFLLSNIDKIVKSGIINLIPNHRLEHRFSVLPPFILGRIFKSNAAGITEFHSDCGVLIHWGPVSAFEVIQPGRFRRHSGFLRE